MVRSVLPITLPITLLLALSLSAAAAGPAAEEPAGSATYEESDVLTRVRQLTYEGRRAGEGYFSPDGSKLVFQSERQEGNPFFQIYVLDLETGDTRRVSPGVGKTTCAFFRPGSGDVLFASTHHDPESEAHQRRELEERAAGREKRYAWDYDPEMEIWVEEADSGELVRLTDARGYDAEGSYAPDGEWIVFTSNRPAYERELSEEEQAKLEVDPSYFAEIYRMRADGSDVERLTRTPGYDGGPFYFPDGSRIVWRRFDEEGLIADVWTMQPDGSDERQITDFESMSWAPYVHPSGAYVFFASNKHGFENFELFIVDVEGTKRPVRVTTTDGFDGLPVPSPDGDTLVWTSTRQGGGKGQLFMARWNHGAALAALEAAPRRAPEPATPREVVELLAAPGMEGRLTGSPGARAAADFIEGQLLALGARPLPGQDGFTLPFDFTAGVEDAGSALTLTPADGEAASYAGADTVQALSFSDSGEVTAPLAFAGYGLVVPEGQEVAYDSYAGVDVEGRIAVVLRYFPEDADQDTRSVLARYSGLRYKALHARENGAVGMLLVTGPRSPNAGEVVPMTFDTAISGSGLLAASASGAVAERIFAAAGRELETVQKSLDDANPHVTGFAIPDLEATLTVGVKRERKEGVNVVGYLPATVGDGELPPAPWIVLGAHFDHLGRGGHGNSLAKKEEAGEVHHGADDNASGVAALLAAGQRLAGMERGRRVVLAFWSGEELGLLGSSDFVDDGTIDAGQVAAYLNFDMVGRLRDNRLTLQAAGSSPDWPGLAEAANVPVGFDLNLQDDPYLPTDSASFNRVEVPTLAFFTGSHEDYHRPTDTAEKIDYEGIDRVARFAALLTGRLASAPEPPEFVVVERKTRAGGDRDSLRAFTGTIPDYTTEVEGLRLSGVIEGGPADRAGLREGDVIVHFAGQEITNIYDYTYALDAVKIGQPVTVVVLRGGERMEVEITPTARE